MTFDEQITDICNRAYFHLYRINNLRKYLDTDTLKTIIHAFIFSTLDYCNILYYNLPKKSLLKLQKVQNYAARILTNTRRFEHITPILRELHWLPITDRIKFKILVTTYKCINGQSPKYLKDLLISYTPTRNLRSQSKNLLVKPRINKISSGGRSFAFAAPNVWNALTEDLKSSTSMNNFRSQLKTHLFELTYVESS